MKLSWNGFAASSVFAMACAAPATQSTTATAATTPRGREAALQAADLAEQRAETCKELRAVALERGHLQDDAGIVRVWKTLAGRGCVVPDVFRVVSYRLAPAHKKQGACADLAAMAKEAWVGASSGEQAAIISTVMECSSAAERDAHLSFVPPERMTQYWASLAEGERRFRSDEARRRLEESRREALHNLHTSCLDTCSRLYSDCVRACSGTGCTVCGQSQQSCNNGCAR